MSDSRLDTLQRGLNNAIEQGKTLSLKKADGQQAQQSIDASIREIHNMESDVFNQQNALQNDLSEARNNLSELVEYSKNCPFDQQETIAAAIVSAKNQISILEAKSNELERTKNQLLTKDDQLLDQQSVIYEDNKLTTEELAKTNRMIDDLSKQIEQRKAEIRATRDYANNAGGACQKGIDVIFGTDGSRGIKQPKEPKQQKSVTSNKEFPVNNNTPSRSEENKPKKTGGSWMNASRSWNQNLYN